MVPAAAPVSPCLSLSAVVLRGADASDEHLGVGLRIDSQDVRQAAIPDDLVGARGFLQVVDQAGGHGQVVP
jgi:hypothetical protein